MNIKHNGQFKLRKFKKKKIDVDILTFYLFSENSIRQVSNYLLLTIQK